MSGPVAPPISKRLLVAVAIALVAGAYEARLSLLMPHFGTDFDPVRLGARLLLHGETPYSIGPGRVHPWNFPLLYPLPAVLLAIPFAALPIVWARVAFVGLTSGALAYVVTRVAWWPLLVFASGAWLQAAGLAQWSPILLAAWYVPALGLVVAAKPNVGLASIAGARSRSAALFMLAQCAAIVVVSFAVHWSWFAEWRQSIVGQPHIRPLAASWLGAPLLVAAIRWRRPEARLLLALSVLPQNPSLYEGVLLFAIPNSAVQALMLATLSWFVEPLSGVLLHGTTFADSARASGIAMCLLMYLPSLVAVLSRANHDAAENDTGADCGGAH